MKYCDLNIDLTQYRSVDQIKPIVDMLTIMSISCVAIQIETQNVQEYLGIFRREGIDIFTRWTIQAKRWAEIAREVDNLRKKYDIIAVKPLTLETARRSARSKNIDIVTITPFTSRYMDKSQATLLKEHENLAEVSLRPLLLNYKTRKDFYRVLRSILIILRRAAAFNAPLIVTSGARSVFELWHPKSIYSFLVTIGIPENICKQTLLYYPMKLINKIQYRL